MAYSMLMSAKKWKDTAITIVAWVGSYVMINVVGLLTSGKSLLAWNWHWGGLAVGLATFLFFSFVFGTLSRSADR